MFSAILLAHNDSSRGVIEDLAHESRQVSMERVLYRFPQPYELTKLLNAIQPDLVFLDLSEWEIALEAAAYIQQAAPHTATVGFGAGWDAGQEQQCAAAGLSALLVSPVTLPRFQESVERAIQKVRGGVLENLVAFLPAKAGSGATTLALNTAGYLAAAGRKVLLIDADLNSGVIALLLDHKHGYTLRDALAESQTLDFSSWSRFVTRKLGVDLLLSEHKRRLPLPSWASYHHLLDFAAPRYDHVLVDLPEVINDATVEIVRRAKQVFVVCTPELASLALAPQRCEELTGRAIPAEKVELLVNRRHPGEIKGADIESMIGHRVAAIFGNDYPAVADAANAAGLVHRDTPLGASLAAFARKLSGAPEPPRGALAFLKGLGSKAPRPARA
jgi:pilus assembly protein CpaE